MRMPKINRLLAVDPGLHTGWALFKANGGPVPQVVLMGTISARHTDAPWLQRMAEVVEAFDGLISCQQLDQVVFEGPQFMGGMGGMTVAMSGDLVKLAVLTGGLVRCAQLHNVRTILATPAQWKGQLSKNASRIRCEKILGYRLGKSTNHARDAIGLGLWAFGLF